MMNHSDSEHDTGSTSNSDWINDVEKKKRKMEEQNDLTEIFQEARKQTNLSVCCGNEKGDLYREKYYIGEKCILCKGKWYSPHQFEIIGGKGHNKKWKFSIYYKPSNGFKQVQLLKLIQSGVLPEFGHLKESLFRPVAQTDGRNYNEIPVCGQDISQLDSSSDESTSVATRLKLNKRKSAMLAENVSRRIRESVGSSSSDRDSSSDESTSVAKRLKLNKRKSAMLAENVSKRIRESVGSSSSDRDSSSDESTSVAKRLKLKRRKSAMLAKNVSKMITESSASDREPGVSPVVEEPVLTTADLTGAGQLSLSASPAEWQNPVASEETLETRQLQLYELLTKQFNTINNTLQSIDLSLKKLVEKQSQDTLPQSISITP
ncbi:serine-rich adhesin for platelets-like isoform X2 [Pseudorasbora parva]|uniref:serine-rich adhesin for platelets-like isoform X2 n=1 Tax=Pseudorasbora parva TaxID=51549 RepID=UPI00351E50FC